MNAREQKRMDAEAVLESLEQVGPQSLRDLQTRLGLTKRRTEDALYVLRTQDKCEYTWPTTSPLTFQASRR